MADWTLGTSRDEHLDEHNLFDHDAMLAGTEGQVIAVSGGKYKPVDEAATTNHDALSGVSADDHHAEDHAARHTAGGADPLLSDLDAVARVEVLDGGVSVGSRRGINFIEGNDVTLTVTDDGANERVNVTIAAASYSVGDLTDVVLSNPQNGDVLQFNGADWVNVPA